MTKSNIAVAVTMAFNGSALFNAIPQANADDLVALNMHSGKPGVSVQSSASVPMEATGEELLARGLARLTAARQPQDYRVAYDFFQIAANKGNAEAQFQLAIMQLDNEYVRQDEGVAIQWLEKAVAQGHGQAVVALDYVLNDGGYIGC